jgi:flagellar motor switch protein FliN/FliY
MSNPLKPDDMAISQDEIERLTAGLAPDDLGLADDEVAPVTLSQSELDHLLAAANFDEPADPASLSLSQEELDLLGLFAETSQPAPAPAPSAAAPVRPAPAGPKAPPTPVTIPQTDIRPVQFAPLVEPASAPPRNTIDLLLDVELKLTAELGQTRLTIREILELGTGSIVELNRLAGEPVDITINNALIAKGEVVVVDEKFGIRVLDVVSPAKRVASVM